MVFFVYSPKAATKKAAKVDKKIEKYIEAQIIDEESENVDNCRRVGEAWFTFIGIVCLIMGSSGLYYYSTFTVTTKVSIVWPDSGPDPALVYTACGGVVEVRENGRAYISYRNGTKYGYDERCAWIVKSGTGKANLTFLNHSFKGYNTRDGCIVAELDELEETITCKRWNASKYEVPLTVRTPAVVYFTSYNRTTYNGFILEVLPVENGGPHYLFEQPDTYHVCNRRYGAMASSSTPSRRNSLLERMTVFQPIRSMSYTWRRTFTVTPTNSTECRDYVVAYKLPKFHKSTYAYSTACYITSQLGHSENVLTTDDAVIILNWGPGPANNSACAVEWKDDYVKSRYSSYSSYSSYASDDYDYRRK